MAKKTVAELERQIIKLEAAQIIRLKCSYDNALKASTEKYMGSGLIIQVTDLEGKNVIDPTMIVDGFSKELIDALRAEIHQSQSSLLLWTTINHKEAS